MTTRRATALLTLCLAIVIAGGCAGGAGDRDAGADTPELREYPLGGDFTLTSHQGTPFRLADAKGKIVLLFFGFVTCPDVCPLTMSKIADAVKKVEGAREALEVLFVTVDVDRDSPEALARYVTSFDVPMIGLTGTRAEIDRVVEQYRAAYEITPSASAGGYEVSHTSYTYAIDRSGQVRALISHDDSAEQIAALLRLLLQT